MQASQSGAARASRREGETRSQRSGAARSGDTAAAEGEWSGTGPHAVGLRHGRSGAEQSGAGSLCRSGRSPDRARTGAGRRCRHRRAGRREPQDVRVRRGRSGAERLGLPLPFGPISRPSPNGRWPTMQASQSRAVQASRREGETRSQRSRAARSGDTAATEGAERSRAERSGDTAAAEGAERRGLPLPFGPVSRPSPNGRWPTMQASQSRAARASGREGETRPQRRWQSGAERSGSVWRHGRNGAERAPTLWG